MATMANPPALAMARCTAKACPWRWRSGPDRLCPDHTSEYDLTRAAASLGIEMAPGDYGNGDGDDGRRGDSTGCPVSADHPPRPPSLTTLTTR